MAEINPAKYESEFLDWLKNSYQGSNKRIFRYYTEELFRQGKEEDFVLRTDKIEETIAELKNLIRQDLDYSLWPPVCYAHQKVLEYIIEKIPQEKDSLEEIRRGISPSTFEEIDEHNYFDKSIEEKAKRRKKQLIDGQVLQNVFEDLSWDKEVVLRTLYDTACRRGEIIAIKVKDLNFDSNFAPVTIELKRQGTQNNKGEFVIQDTLKIRDNRLVMASESSKKLIRNQIEEKELDYDDFLFFPDVKRSTAYGKIQRLIDDAFEGYPKPEKLTPHNFRHTRATEIVKKFSLNDAKKYLGHKHIQNTEVYSHIDIETDVLKKISGNGESKHPEKAENTSNNNLSQDKSAEEILKEKFAKSQISKEEFEEKMQVLQKY